MLANKVALVFGGTRGIGLATARLFRDNGARVIVTGRKKEGLQKAREQLGAEVEVVQSDMANAKDLRQLVGDIKKHHGALDVAFINAGIATPQPHHEVNEEDFDSQVGINFRGAFFAAKHSSNIMNNKGSIIFVSSVAGIMGIEGLSIYSATKSAVISLSRTLAADLSPRSIRVNSISPGFIKTELSMKNNAGMIDEICQGIPLGKTFGMPDDIAQAALFLASNKTAGYITGTNIIVDGGLSKLNLN